MISRKAVGTRMNSAVAINARILTSIISSVFLIRNNSGFNPLEMVNISSVNSMNELPLDDLESDQYHE
jgi:hypothetical protein